MDQTLASQAPWAGDARLHLAAHGSILTRSQGTDIPSSPAF